MSEPRCTITLGDEHDDDLRAVLAAALERLDARSTGGDWSLGGSQERLSAQFDVQGQAVLIESETYVGLSITGPQTIIDQIAHDVTAHKAETRRATKG